MDLSINLEYDRDHDADTLEENRPYWNSNDGEVFIILELSEDYATVVTPDGSRDRVFRPDSIFHSEEIGHSIHPLSLDRISAI